VVIADFGLGEALLTVLEIFLFVIWFWILIYVLTDLFRDHQISGWAKAAWVLFLVVLPLLGSLVYLIARGDGMRDRTIKAQAEARHHYESMVQEAAASGSPADELAKLSDLKQKGMITDDEFARAKEKLLT
jgi:Phospholipase_D-nuclease N-terminal/Short C-terminal domain